MSVFGHVIKHETLLNMRDFRTIRFSKDDGYVALMKFLKIIICKGFLRFTVII